MPVAVITVTLDDGHTDQECMGCCMARNVAILQGLAAEGLIDMGDSAPPS